MGFAANRFLIVWTSTTLAPEPSSSIQASFSAKGGEIDTVRPPHNRPGSPAHRKGNPDGSHTPAENRKSRASPERSVNLWQGAVHV
ncbi:hypothetical protein BDW22DRAFT_1356391 [Trametopsis cervina]|nr:hypothetical protein BDW22DRAFT_1356391 [Trametopsis cervina]